jgi:small-conductance mechanosensitive channel
LQQPLGNLLANPWVLIVVRVSVALLATVMVWWIGGRLKRVVDWVFDRIEDALHLRSQGSSLGRLTGAAGPLSTLLDTLAALLRFLVWAVLLYGWLLLIAYLLDESHRSVDLILDPVKTTLIAAGRGLVEFLPDLVILTLIVAFGRVLHSVVVTVGRGIALGRIRAFGLDPSVATPTRRLLTFALWVSMIVLAAPYLPGAGSKAFQAISVLLGLLVSLGSSSLISNLIGGLSLTYAHAFRVGDRVRIGEYLGDIVALGAITTRLRTIKDEEIVLPNGMVSAAAIVNYSQYAGTTGVQAHAEVTIGYETASDRVERALVAAALDTPSIQPEPAPYVLQTELHDYYVRYELCAYTKRPTELHLIEANLRRKMQQHLFADGIEICSPAFLALRDGNAIQLPNAAQQALAASSNQEVRQEHAIANSRAFVVKVGSRSE